MSKSRPGGAPRCTERGVARNCTWRSCPILISYSDTEAVRRLRRSVPRRRLIENGLGIDLIDAWPQPPPPVNVPFQNGRLAPSVTRQRRCDCAAFQMRSHVLLDQPDLDPRLARKCRHGGVRRTVFEMDRSRKSGMYLPVQGRTPSSWRDAVPANGEWATSS